MIVDEYNTADEWPRRDGDDFWRNFKGSPMVARLRKRQGVKADLLAAAAAIGAVVPDKATVADLHELLGPEPGARLEYGRPSLWPFDDWTGVDIKYANRGTVAHELTEWLDKGGSPDKIPTELVERAATLDITAELLSFIAHDWGRFRDEHGLVPTFIECTVVCDELMVAGTGDEFATVTTQIVTPFGTVEAGDLVVVDKKTSDDCVRPGYIVQLARYAHSVPYDTDTDMRGEWPQPVNKRIGFIAQLRMSAAIDGDTSIRWELIPADIATGYAHAVEVHRLANLDVSAAFGEPIATPTSPSPLVVESPGGGDGHTANVQSPPPTIDDLRASIDHWSDKDKANLRDVMIRSGVDRTDPTEVAAAIAAYHFHDVATQAPVAPAAPVVVPLTTPTNPDEGPVADEDAMSILESRYKALDAAGLSWVGSIVSGAQRANTPFHLKVDAGGKRTVRRFEILRGLVALAGCGFDNDDAVRGCLMHAIGAELADSLAFDLGRLVGCMNATEAAVFADVAVMLAEQPTAGYVTRDGAFRVEVAA